jgi:transposase
MPAPYPYELRKRAILAINNGERIGEVSKRFIISRNTLYKWISLQKETGSIRPRFGYQKGHGQIIKDRDKFEEFLKANNNKTSKELADLWGAKVSATTIRASIKKLGYTYKKNFLSPQEERWIKAGV